MFSLFSIPGLFALLLAVLGGLLLWLGRRQRQSSGLPAGTMLYRDTEEMEAPERPLRSRRYGLVGRPDYLVRTRERGRRYVVPVEVKSRRRPAQPYASHILQLAAYCLLVEDNFDAAPPYGLLRYADATLQIPYTDELRGRAGYGGGDPAGATGTRRCAAAIVSHGAARAAVIGPLVGGRLLLSSFSFLVWHKVDMGYAPSSQIPASGSVVSPPKQLAARDSLSTDAVRVCPNLQGQPSL